MSSHKEKNAWKEASVVEDSNFRPTKSNRRKAPFYKVLQGMPIAVDAFRYGAIPDVTAYFLTYVVRFESFIVIYETSDTHILITIPTYLQAGRMVPYIALVGILWRILICCLT